MDLAWARMSETRTAYRAFMGKLWKYPLRRLRVRWQDNIKKDLKRTICEDRRWLDLTLFNGRLQY
jgi:hypothetical protein